MELLEIGCRIASQSQISGPFARQWNLAAMAMYEGFGTELPFGVAGGTMASHRADHAVERFPGDARFLLAQIRERERAVYWYLFVNRVAVEGPAPRDTSAIIAASGARQMVEIGDAFEVLRAASAVRTEATVRAAFWRVMTGRVDDALRLLDEFEKGEHAADPWNRYLAYLFRGRLLAETDKHEEAIASYTTAVDVWPGDSARAALAASLFVADRRDEAATVVRELLKSPPSDRRDPWAWYAFGEHRFWEERRQQLRHSFQ